MAEHKASYRPGADVFAGWRDNVLTGQGPTLYPVGTGELSRIEVGPGLVTLIGGAPGTGKTALTMQAVVDALRMTPTLRAVVCNIEMSPETLLDRQLARLSGIDLTDIRYRRLGGEHADRVDQALCTLESLAERLAFVRPPFDLSNVAATVDDFRGGLILLDYIQRIRPPGEHADRRHAVDKAMDSLRQFADVGTAVIVVSALSRTKDAKGRSSYSGDGLNLASFRESSELEFGGDSCFVLVPGNDANTVTLRCLKDRNGEPLDIRLQFDRRRQRFSPLADSPPDPQAAGKLRSALAELWDRTPAAKDDEL